MNTVVALFGAALVLTALFEVLVTVLHPDARGRITGWSERGVWRLIGAGSRLLGDRAYRLGGPAAVAVGVGWWVFAIWFGFGLVWLGVGSSLAAPSSSLFDGTIDLWDALYLSGASLTTVGFGDVVAATPPTRLLAVFEAGLGLVVLTSSITYVLSVYPLVASKRAAAAYVRDLRGDEAEGAAELTFELGPDEIRSLQRDLIALGQNLRRFPVLYYFHASRYEEEMTPLIRATLLVAACASGADPDRAPALLAYRRPLARACDRFLDDLQEEFGVTESDAQGHKRRREQLRSLGALIHERWPDSVWSEAVAPMREIEQLLDRGERLLVGLARDHGYEHRQLISVPSRG